MKVTASHHQLDVKVANKEFVEGSSVTPWAGGQVVSCLCPLDVKREGDGVTPLAGGRVLLCHASAFGCERYNKELVEDNDVTPLAKKHVVSCLRLLDVKNPTNSL